MISQKRRDGESQDGRYGQMNQPRVSRGEIDEETRQVAAAAFKSTWTRTRSSSRTSLDDVG